MRDIKFRAWRKVNNREHCKMLKQERFLVISRFFAKIERDVDARYTLMQYTGIKDKNGVEIYEGDILKWNNDDEQISETVFHEFAFYHYFNEMYEDFSFDDSKLFEIIGNIYENPDILNDEK